MNEEEKKAIRDLIDSSNLSLIGDGTIITSRQTVETVLNLIETQKAEIEKRDKMIEEMAEDIIDYEKDLKYDEPFSSIDEVVGYYRRYIIPEQNQ